MIERETTALLLTRGRTPIGDIGVRFSWDPMEPLAVVMTVLNPEDSGEDVPWWFGRELLKRGLETIQQVGEGDVRVKRQLAVGRFIVCLRSPDGHADLAFPVADIQKFVREIYDVVPEVGEIVPEDDIDRFIAEVLG